LRRVKTGAVLLERGEKTVLRYTYERESREWKNSKVLLIRR
jgi:hypothetical protein